MSGRGEGNLLLPAGTRLLHIGPHKTGTTFLQAAFHAARPEVERQGVHYASHNRQAKQAARAVTERGSPYNRNRVPAARHWRMVVRRLETTQASRALLTAEGFADADDHGIARIIRDLDPARVHVIATLRPLTRILSSQWQQYVQNGLERSYEEWLDAMLNRPNEPASRRFWRRHRHDVLIGRWAAVAGVDRTTAVVVDDREYEGVLRTFEALLGLREGTLRPAEGLGNRSLTRPEIDLIQAMHRGYEQYLDDKGLRLNLVLHGAATNLKLRESEPGVPKIETPAWAMEKAAEVSRTIIEGIRASGVRVIGDLDVLVEGGARTTEDSRAGAQSRAGAKAGSAATAAPKGENGAGPGASDAARARIAATAAMGVLIHAGMTRRVRAADRDASGWPDGPAVRPERRRTPRLDHWSTQRLVSLVGKRVRSAMRGRAAPIRRLLKRVRPNAARRARRSG